ncbi:hypothetical protein DFH28DRAFT_19572 [Melampsora americana]|nr:hypothetical protein DFH28DRAFT_19572 [Melampsora americana]
MTKNPLLLLIFTLAFRMHTSLTINPSEEPVSTMSIASSDNFYSNPIEESSKSTNQELDLISRLAATENQQKGPQDLLKPKFLGLSIWEFPVRIRHHHISSRKYNKKNTHDNVNLPQKSFNVLQKRDGSPNEQTDTPELLDEDLTSQLESTVPDQQDVTQDVDQQQTTQDDDVTLTSGQSDFPAQDLSPDSEISSSVDSLADGQDSTLSMDMDETYTELGPSTADSTQEYHYSWEYETSSESSIPDIPESVSQDSTVSEQDSSLSPETGTVTHMIPQDLATEAVIETVPETPETFEYVPSDTTTSSSQSPTVESKSFIAKESTDLTPESGVVTEKFSKPVDDTSNVSKSEGSSTRTKLGNLDSSASDGAFKNETKKSEEPGTLGSSKATKIPSKSEEVTPTISSGDTPTISSGDTPTISSGDTPTKSSGGSISVSSGALPIASSGNSSSTVSNNKESKDMPGGVVASFPKEKPSSTVDKEEKPKSTKPSDVPSTKDSNINSTEIRGSPNNSSSGEITKSENDPNKIKEDKLKKERQSKALSIGIFSGLAGGLACTIFLAMIV